MHALTINLILIHNYITLFYKIDKNVSKFTLYHAPYTFVYIGYSALVIKGNL